MLGDFNADFVGLMDQALADCSILCVPSKLRRTPVRVSSSPLSSHQTQVARGSQPEEFSVTIARPMPPPECWHSRSTKARPESLHLPRDIRCPVRPDSPRDTTPAAGAKVKFDPATKSSEARFSQNNRVVLAFVEFSESCINVASNLKQFEIRPKMEQLSLTTRTPGSNLCAVRKSIE